METLGRPRAERSFEVLATGPLTTVQDLGRPGLAALGVGRSGAADPAALRLANRLVGNEEAEATLEVTFGGLCLRGEGGLTVALTGASCPMSVAGRQVSAGTAVWIPDGAELRIGQPASGLRSYLAIRGGLDLPQVLGSRSTDTLAGLGPAPLVPGQRMGVRGVPGWSPGVDVAPASVPQADEVVLRVSLGPREDWFTPAARAVLVTSSYEVTGESDRIGMRLTGPALERAREGEIPSEGMVTGGLQVPPTGQPTLLLADHPVTGGYPVIAVVISSDIGKAAQARPGQQIRFRPA